MKLLVIDDEKDILILIKKALSSDYEVTTVHRPFEEIPESLADYDLLITDVMMPGEDGYSLLSRIRDKTDAPIIFYKINHSFHPSCHKCTMIYGKQPSFRCKIDVKSV